MQLSTSSCDESHCGICDILCCYSEMECELFQSIIAQIMTFLCILTLAFFSLYIMQQYTFPRGVIYPRYYIRYTSEGRTRSTTTSIYQTTYTLRNLGFEQTYNITIRARMRYTYCSSYLYGEYSDEISVTTMETG